MGWMIGVSRLYPWSLHWLMRIQRPGSCCRLPTPNSPLPPSTFYFYPIHHVLYCLSLLERSSYNLLREPQSHSSQMHAPSDVTHLSDDRLLLLDTCRLLEDHCNSLTLAGSTAAWWLAGILEKVFFPNHKYKCKLLSWALPEPLREVWKVVQAAGSAFFLHTQVHCTAVLNSPPWQSLPWKEALTDLCLETSTCSFNLMWLQREQNTAGPSRKRKGCEYPYIGENAHNEDWKIKLVSLLLPIIVSCEIASRKEKRTCYWTWHVVSESFLSYCIPWAHVTLCNTVISA